MRDIALDGFFRTDEGLPAFVWDVELRDGEDFDGKFDVQFAAVENDAGEVAFAINVRGFAPFVRDWDEGTRELVDDLIENREFIACINYENRGWDEPSGGYTQMMMGRDFGEQFDLVQRLDLSAQDVAALREIRSVLNERTG